MGPYVDGSTELFQPPSISPIFVKIIVKILLQWTRVHYEFRWIIDGMSATRFSEGSGEVLDAQTVVEIYQIVAQRLRNK